MARPRKTAVVAQPESQAPAAPAIVNPVKALAAELGLRQKKPGRQLEFSDRERHLVEELAGYGFPKQEIARMMGIDIGTLNKTFADELFLGKASKIMAVSRNLFEIATSKAQNAVPAAMYILKTQGGQHWKDITRTEVTGADGGALQVENRTVDPATLNDEQREALRDIMMSALKLTGQRGLPEPEVIEGEIVRDDTEGYV